MNEQLPDDTSYRTIGEHLRALERREYTITQLVELYLRRIERLDPDLNAFVTVFADEAMSAAARADAQASARARPPLLGIPIACKDIIEYEGHTTTWGSRALPDRQSQITATVITRLREAGAIIIGKTQSVEFALGGWGTNKHCGTPRNPWDRQTHRVPGGSSSGSGVATAAGLAAAALGTDTGGSVRLPSAFCGLVGLKPTFGRVSNYGVLPLSDSLDSVGPLARSVEDAALIYELLRGPDPMHTPTLAPPQDEPRAKLHDGVRALRCARLPEHELETASPAVRAAYEGSLETLQSLGAEIVAVTLPQDFATYRDASSTVISAEGYANTAEFIDRDDLPLDPHVRQRMLPGKTISTGDYLRAMRQIEQWRVEYYRAMRGIDALLTPTAATTAIAVEEVDESVIPAYFTRATNVLGLCALALPNGFDDAGLPTSLCIHGRPFDEAGILRIGQALEQATSTARHAPC